MAETPPNSTQDPQFVGCPHCTIQIPAGLKACPHCRQVLSPPGKKASASAPSRDKQTELFGRFRSSGMPQFRSVWWTRHGKWVKVAGPVMGAVLLLLLVYAAWVGYEVHIVPNPALPVKVQHDRNGQKVLLKVFVTNEGEDVPDLSLKSIGVVTEFLYRDGRRERKTVFPKSEYRGEGALLHGETGSVEIEASAKNLKEVILRSKIVDLESGRQLVPPGGMRRYVPDQK